MNGVNRWCSRHYLGVSNISAWRRAGRGGRVEIRSKIWLNRQLQVSLIDSKKLYVDY